MAELNTLQVIVIQTRRDIVRMVHNVNSGHPGGSLGCTEFMVALYNEVMDLKEGFDMDGIGEDASEVRDLVTEIKYLESRLKFGL